MTIRESQERVLTGLMQLQQDKDKVRAQSCIDRLVLSTVSNSVFFNFNDNQIVNVIYLFSISKVIMHVFCL